MTLNEYLRVHKLTAREMSRRLGVKDSTMSRYLHRQRQPEWSVLERLVRLTEGAIREADFFREPWEPPTNNGKQVGG